MKNLLIVGACTIMFLCLPFGKMLQAQAPALYSIDETPYHSSLGTILEKDGYTLDSLREVVTLSRSGKPEVKAAFLRDRIYLVMDLTGLSQTYVVAFKDTYLGYTNELSYNGIPGNTLNTEELVNCVLKYHAAQ